MTSDEENSPYSEHSVELTNEANSRSAKRRRILSATAVAICLTGAAALIVAAVRTREEQHAREQHALTSAVAASPLPGADSPAQPPAGPATPQPELAQPEPAPPSNVPPVTASTPVKTDSAHTPSAASNSASSGSSASVSAGKARAQAHRSRSAAVPPGVANRGLHPTQDFSDLPHSSDSATQDLPSGVTGNDIPAQGISDGSVRGSVANQALPNGSSSEPSPGLPNGSSDTSSPGESSF